MSAATSTSTYRPPLLISLSLPLSLHLFISFSLFLYISLSLSPSLPYLSFPHHHGCVGRRKVGRLGASPLGDDMGANGLAFAFAFAFADAARATDCRIPLRSLSPRWYD